MKTQSGYFATAYLFKGPQGVYEVVDMKPQSSGYNGPKSFIIRNSKGKKLGLRRALTVKEASHKWVRGLK